MKKRIVSIILAVIMIASVLPLGAISVLAESKEGTDVNSPEIAEAYGTYFTGDYTDSVFKITGTYSNGVHFNDITFENISYFGAKTEFSK